MQHNVEIKKGFNTKLRNFYVYLHIKESDGTVFYVGKGTKFRWSRVYDRTQHWKNTAIKHGVICKIVAHDLSAEEALVLEKKLIASYGRQDQKTGCLVNLTDGGDGVVNYVWTEEHRKKISEAGMGKRHTPETKEKIRQANVGRTFSAQTLKLMSDARKGTPWTEAQRKASESRIDPRSRSVICLNSAVIYSNVADVAKALNLDNSGVSKVCYGKRKQYNGFRFKFLDEYISEQSMNSENAA